MKRFLQRTFVVLWAVLGCTGVGIIVGWWWLDRALERYEGTGPTVRLIEVAGDGERAACTLPSSMEQFYRMFQSDRGGDLPSFVARVLRCAETESQRQAFVTMLAMARRDGDTIAGRVLEMLTTLHCSALGIVTGTAAKDTAATTRACVDLAMGYASSAHPAADETRARVFRFAQLLTIVTAGVADSAMRHTFCTDAEQLPPDAYDRIAAVRPDLPALIQRACAEPFGNSDVGGSE